MGCHLTDIASLKISFEDSPFEAKYKDNVKCVGEDLNSLNKKYKKNGLKSNSQYPPLSHKKVILLESDFKYSLQVLKAASSKGVEVIITCNLSAFMVEISKNKGQLVSLIINKIFLTQMSERSIFSSIREIPLLIIGDTLFTRSMMKNIPVKRSLFVHKKSGVSVLLNRAFTEDIIQKTDSSFVNLA